MVKLHYPHPATTFHVAFDVGSYFDSADGLGGTQLLRVLDLCDTVFGDLCWAATAPFGPASNASDPDLQERRFLTTSALRRDIHPDVGVDGSLLLGFVDAPPAHVVAPRAGLHNEWSLEGAIVGVEAFDSGSIIVSVPHLAAFLALGASTPDRAWARTRVHAEFPEVSLPPLDVGAEVYRQRGYLLPAGQLAHMQADRLAFEVLLLARNTTEAAERAAAAIAQIGAQVPPPFSPKRVSADDGCWSDSRLATARDQFARGSPAQFLADTAYIFGERLGIDAGKAVGPDRA